MVLSSGGGEEHPGSEPGESLTRSTWSGLQWTYGASLAGGMLQIGYTAAMGRMLAPVDFGVLAIALVFVRFGEYFARAGVGPALVQSPSMTKRMMSTGFRITLALSAAVAVVIITSAELARLLLEHATVVPVVRVMALGLIITAVGVPAESLLRRELRFRRVALNHLASFAIGYLLIGIVLALMGAGVWSLVAAHLSQATLYSMFNVAARRFPLLAGWDRGDARALIGFGGRVSLISFAEFLGSSLDTLVIGRVAGGAQLGQYNRAFLLVTLPLERLMQGVQRVLFPAFSRIQTERERLARVYRSALSLAGAILVPTASGMAAASAPLVLVVLGDQWSLAAEILPYLAFSAVGSLLALLGAVLCEATADLNRKLALQTVHVVVLLALLLLAGSELRLLATAVALAQLVRVVGYFAFMQRIIGVALREHLALLAPSVVTGVAVGLVGLQWNGLLEGRVSAPVLLAVHVASGGLLLLLSLRIGPLSGVRRDLAVWLERAAVLGKVPPSIRRLGGLSGHG